MTEAIVKIKNNWELIKGKKAPISALSTIELAKQVIKESKPLYEVQDNFKEEIIEVE